MQMFFIYNIGNRYRDKKYKTMQMLQNRLSFLLVKLNSNGTENYNFNLSRYLMV